MLISAVEGCFIDATPLRRFKKGKYGDTERRKGLKNSKVGKLPVHRFDGHD